MGDWTSRETLRSEDRTRIYWLRPSSRSPQTIWYTSTMSCQTTRMQESCSSTDAARTLSAKPTGYGRVTTSRYGNGWPCLSTLARSEDDPAKDRRHLPPARWTCSPRPPRWKIHGGDKPRHHTTSLE